MYQKLGLTAVIISIVAINIADAQLFPRLFCDCGTCDPCRKTARERRAERACRRCARLSCSCPAPVATPAPCVVPTVQTTMVPKSVITYRNVPQTVNCRVPYTESVPVTTYRSVMVDEGGYQQVWVPKMVSRQVPQTSYQQQTRYRDVSYQVNRRVAERTIQYVPRQRVIYRPMATPFVAPPTSSCPTCNETAVPSTVPSTPQIQPIPETNGSTTYMPPNLPYQTNVTLPGVTYSQQSAPFQSTYVPPMTSELPATSTPAYTPPQESQAVPSPTPDPAMNEPSIEDRTGWKTIRQRTSAVELERADGVELSSGYRTLNQSYDSEVTRTAASGPALRPTAASVWQTQVR